MEKLRVINENIKCCLCKRFGVNTFRYGPKYKLGKITAHYYCLLLSNKLPQKGNDDEGILGFLVCDIKKEIQRTRDILCTYCGKGNANIECCIRKCKKVFHLPCGLKKGSSHQFIDKFSSFCHVHRPVQNIPYRVLKEASKTRVVCCICQEKVNIKSRDGIWAPCCRKRWYHRDCVQKLAYSAGYFCKCPACNDDKKFNTWMQRFGIFIPKQDASWELVPNAFEDLLFRYGTCDAEECKCPDGRKKNSQNTMWEIIVCESCGSQGIHVACGNLKFVDPEWECPGCKKITKNVKSTKTEVSNSSKGDQGSSKQEKSYVGKRKRERSEEESENSVLDKRKRCRPNPVEDDEEVEIDVETVGEGMTNDETEAGRVDKSKTPENVAVQNTSDDNGLDEVLCMLKPGPLSYKLSTLLKCLENQLTPEEKCKPPDLIDLTLSDKEDSDVEVIEVTERSLGHNRTRGTGNVCGCEKPDDAGIPPPSEEFQVSRLERGRVATNRSNVPFRPVVFQQGSRISQLTRSAAVTEEKNLGKAIDDEVIILTD